MRWMRCLGQSVLQTLEDGLEHELILVPDTNALILAPEVAEYHTVASSRAYTAIIEPIVLGELDKLKIAHRDPEFRDEVNSVIKRIKGLGTQGGLLARVSVNKTITVKMVAPEPSFGRH